MLFEQVQVVRYGQERSRACGYLRGRMSSYAQQPRLDPRWVEARFDRIASTYPFFERLFLLPARSRRLAVDRLRLQAGDHVLSIGCGRGPMLPRLSKAVGANGRVLGIDLSRRMLDAAERCVRKHALGNVDLVRANVFDHTSVDRFDAILFGFSLTSFGDPHAALDHAWRLLAPDGRLVVLDGQVPPCLVRCTRPIMPLIRRFLEATVLGDPDMRPVDAVRRLAPVEVEYFRGGAYFVISASKPRDGRTDERMSLPE